MRANQELRMTNDEVRMTNIKLRIIHGELRSNRPSPRSGRWNCSPGWSEAEPGVYKTKNHQSPAWRGERNSFVPPGSVPLNSASGEVCRWDANSAARFAGSRVWTFRRERRVGILGAPEAR